MLKWLLIICVLLCPCALGEGEAPNRPAVTLPEQAKVGEAFTLEWTPVQGAEFYSVNFQSLDDPEIYFGDDTRENRYTYYDMRLKAGRYEVTVAAFPNGGGSQPVTLELREPAAENAFAYTGYHIKDGVTSAVQLTRYLGGAVPASVTIPESVNSAITRAMGQRLGWKKLPAETLPVVSLGEDVLKNNGTLKEVTIPKGVTGIDDNAFRGSVDLTIKGYTGSEAHRVAMENGYNFIPLDNGKGDFEITWKEPLLINEKASFTIKGKNIEAVEIYMGGERLGWFNNEKGKKSFKAETYLREKGNFTLNAVAHLKNGERQYSAYLPIEVTGRGSMPAIEDISLSAHLGTAGETPKVITVERGTNVYVTVGVPKGYRYINQGYQAPGETSVLWYPDPMDTKDKRLGMTKDRHLTRLLAGISLTGIGDYHYYLALKADKGYEETVTDVTIRLVSTRPFEYLEDQKAIFNYQGGETEAVLPLEIDGLPVTGVYNSAFEGSGITSVVIPEGIERIGKRAFAECKDLTSVTLPKSLNQIQNNAFEGCVSLETIALPPNAGLPSGLFLNCRSLKEVVLPENLASLSAGKQDYTSPFHGCAALEKVTVSARTKVMESGSIPAGVIIRAPKGSTAEKYAKKFKHPFEAIK